jgi:lipopolysaccharide biosynthesis glycosyltransferase/LPS sulfotransferase NodH
MKQQQQQQMSPRNSPARVDLHNGPVKYNILVPLLPVEEEATAPSLLRHIPLPLRFLLYVCAFNFCWLVFFSSHHFDDHRHSLLPAERIPVVTHRALRLQQQTPSVSTELNNNNTHTAAKEDTEANVLVVIISNRLAGIIPTVSSILTHTSSKPVDLVLIGDPALNEKVRQHFSAPTRTRQRAIHTFTSLTVESVQADLLAQGYQPIWTWPEWGSSRSSTWRNQHTLHVAEWDELETHAHELNHLRFYLPLVSQFRKHKYLYFLDDDILVQKDLGHVVDSTLQTLHPSKGLVTPCNIWIWNSDCHHFGFESEETIKPILQMPSLYGDRHVCQSEAETHCYPASYPDFLDSVLPANNYTNPKDQKAWNFGFSLFALDHWRANDLTARYEAVMKESYRLHVFPETSLTFGLGVSYIAFAGAVECWNDKEMKVRDGFGFIEWNRYEQTFGKDFLEKDVDVLHYTGPHKPWVANTTIEPRSLQPWLNYMEQEGMSLPDQLPVEPASQLFTLLASDRTGAQWIMSALDSHPNVCASGEGDKPESGFPVDVLFPEGLPWFPVCSVKRGCSFAFVRNAVLELAESMDLRGRTGKVPARCQPGYDRHNDSLGDHLPRICNFMDALHGNYTEGAIEAVWVDAFRKEDQNLLGCSCQRGTTVKGLKVFTEWLAYQNFPYHQTGPPGMVLDDSALSGSKIIRLKRRNLWARYKSTIMAQKSNMYHLTSPGDKRTQLATVGNMTVSVEEMLLKIFQMKTIDAAGDLWAKKHGSEVLNVDYEDCRDDTAACFLHIFDFLEVDPSHVTKEAGRFASAFAPYNTDSSLDHIENKGAVQEALGVSGYGEFVGIKNFTEVQLLIYDDSETLEKTHQFHQEKGINATMFGRTVHGDESKNYSSKFSAAVPLLQNMLPETLVVLSDNRDVRVQFPAGSDFLRYDAIYEFRSAFEELTHQYPGAVVASTESHCCASALTHAKPGDFYRHDGRRKRRSCVSGQPGCEWAGDEKSWPWQSFMQELAAERSHTDTANLYLDASLLAGKAGDLLKFIKAANVGQVEDDRAVLTDFMYHNPNLLVLDYESRLFGKNREGLHSETNIACPFGPPSIATARQLEISKPTPSLFMHTLRELGCLSGKKIVEKQIFPRWDGGGIQIGPILDHLDRVAEETASIVVPDEFLKTRDYRRGQGPEVPYFVDERAVWSSKLIRDRTDEATLEWRTEPTEALIRMAHQILKLGGDETEARWSTLRRALRSGGFPYWAWYGDFKKCSFHNYENASIPLFTPSARADCDYAFPVPNYMNIIDSQRTSDNWRGLFRDTKVKYPWESKIRKVVWRGSLSEADQHKALTSARWRVNKLVHALNSDLYDVGLTSIPPWVSDMVEIDTSVVGGLKGNIDPMASFQRYMAIMDIDGNSWSSRFATLLCYNSVVIKVEPQYVEYFYNDLEPWTHYIPVKDDLSDFNENVAWALDPQNEETVKDIISSANEWCSQRLVPEALAHDLLDTWESYVRLLERADPNWQKEWIKKKSIILSATSNLDLFRLKDKVQSDS